MSLKVLLVDDDEIFSSMLGRILTRAGLDHDAAFDAEHARLMSSREPYSVALIDLFLPDQDGLALISELRSLNSKTRFIVISALDGPEMRDKAYAVGVSAYFVKPFAYSLLIDKIKDLMDDDTSIKAAVEVSLDEKTEGGELTAKSADRDISIGNTTIDLAAPSVCVSGRPVDLTKSELRTLRAIFGGHGKVISREDILRAIYGDHEAPEPKIVDVFVAKLRAKIKKAGADRDPVSTVRGRGYVANLAPGSRSDEGASDTLPLDP